MHDTRDAPPGKDAGGVEMRADRRERGRRLAERCAGQARWPTLRTGSEVVSAVRLKLMGQVLAVGVVAALLALLAWKLTHSETSNVPQALRQGKIVPAPGFDLPRLDRPGRLSLASLRGKAVIVNFWASWCEPCKEESQALESAWRRYRERGLVVVGVDYNDFKGDARGFARRYGMTYPLVHDGPGDVLTTYGATGVPETYFVDRRGRLVADRIQGQVDANDAVREQFERSIERTLTE